MAGSVPGSGGGARVQTRGLRLTSAVSQVAEAHSGDCVALKGFAGRRRGRGCRQPSVAEPFKGRRRALSFRGVGVTYLQQKLLCKY